ncbi:MAG TPA: hypothetical protein VKA46_30480 [Gemmataceae bacterium]|nr:hypothetical protein [Gemmataceae bacterium]
MALILPGKSRCPLCDTVIRAGDDIVATTHFIGDPTDLLWNFSDAAMHKACFLAWKYREEFVAKYNAVMGSITWGNGSYHDMQPDGTIIMKHRESSE